MVEKKSILDCFTIFKSIDLETKELIKYFHVFKDFAIIVTHKEIKSKLKEVSYLKSVFKVTRLNTNQNEMIEFEELRNEDIVEFYQGHNCLFARTNIAKKIFVYNYSNLVAPYFHEILELSDKSIIYISCGLNHNLGLSSQGLVYCWANNNLNQIISKQFDTQNKVLINYIHCHTNKNTSNDCFFGVTFEGKVYFWIEDSETPVICNNLSSIYVSKISSHQSEVFLLTRDNSAYLLREHFDQNTPQHIRNEILNICENLLQSKERVLCFTDNLLEMRNNLNLFDYYLDSEVTKQTIKIKVDKLHNSRYIKSTNIIRIEDNNDPELLSAQFQLLYSLKKYYKKQFVKGKQKDLLPVRIFNKDHNSLEVLKVNGQVDQYYAVKKIHIKDKWYEIFREILIMSKLRESQFVVQFITAWIEWKEDEVFAYIQMELCDFSLTKLIEKKAETFHKDKQGPMNEFECFASLRIVRELNECLDYLHNTLTPGIMHRDLKPDNVLIPKDDNGYRLKIADFGLSKIFKHIKNTSNIGSQYYAAPEVRRGKAKYDLNVDHYSLGMISKDIFYFEKEYEIDLNLYKGTELEGILVGFKTISQQMTAQEVQNRSKCNQIEKSFSDLENNLWQLIQNNNPQINLEFGAFNRFFPDQNNQ